MANNKKELNQYFNYFISNATIYKKWYSILFDANGNKIDNPKLTEDLFNDIPKKYKDENIALINNGLSASLSEDLFMIFTSLIKSINQRFKNILLYKKYIDEFGFNLVDIHDSNGTPINDAKKSEIIEFAKTINHESLENDLFTASELNALDDEELNRILTFIQNLEDCFILLNEFDSDRIETYFEKSHQALNEKIEEINNYCETGIQLIDKENKIFGLVDINNANSLSEIVKAYNEQRNKQLEHVKNNGNELEYKIFNNGGALLERSIKRFRNNKLENEYLITLIGAEKLTPYDAMIFDIVSTIYLYNDKHEFIITPTWIYQLLTQKFDETKNAEILTKIDNSLIKLMTTLIDINSVVINKKIEITPQDFILPMQRIVNRKKKNDNLYKIIREPSLLSLNREFGRIYDIKSDLYNTNDLFTNSWQISTLKHVLLKKIYQYFYKVNDNGKSTNLINLADLLKESEIINLVDENGTYNKRMSAHYKDTIKELFNFWYSKGLIKALTKDKQPILWFKDENKREIIFKFEPNEKYFNVVNQEPSEDIKKDHQKNEDDFKHPNIHKMINYCIKNNLFNYVGANEEQRNDYISELCNGIIENDYKDSNGKEIENVFLYLKNASLKNYPKQTQKDYKERTYTKEEYESCYTDIDAITEDDL